MEVVITIYYAFKIFQTSDTSDKIVKYNFFSSYSEYEDDYPKDDIASILHQLAALCGNVTQFFCYIVIYSFSAWSFYYSCLFCRFYCPPVLNLRPIVSRYSSKSICAAGPSSG
jgi:hypothetical protein